MFKISESPYIRTEMTVEKTMYEVLLALSPIIIFAGYYFGLRVFIHLFIANITALAIEYSFNKIEKKDITAFDGSSFLAVTLLVLTLPHSAEYYVTFTGAIICIFFGKIVFGGLGTNIVNPALFSRIFLNMLFPSSIYTYKNFDLTAGATMIPLIKYQGLDFIKGGIDGIVKMFFFGINELGSMGETSAFLILIGAFYLLIRKHIMFRVPFLILMTTALGGYITGNDPIIYISYGGVFFAAVFMATDMVSSPYTKKALVVYSIGIGVLTTIIREFTSQAEGVSYAILIMNFTAPFLDELFQERVYGTVKDLRERNRIILITAALLISLFTVYKFDHSGIHKKKDKLSYKEERVKRELTEGYEIGEETVKKGDYDFTALYRDNEVKLYYISLSSKGYSKYLIYYAMTINLKNEIENLRIIEQNETKGLGSKISSIKWQNMWRGRDSSYIFNKETDGFAGATFTSYNLYKSIKDVLSSFEIDNSELETWDDIEEW